MAQGLLREIRGVEILAYCLMTNHIHLVAVPTTDDGLQRVLKPLHMRYAQRVSRAKGWKGHLWQGEADGTLTGIPSKVDLKKFTSMHKPRNGS